MLERKNSKAKPGEIDRGKNLRKKREEASSSSSSSLAISSRLERLSDKRDFPHLLHVQLTASATCKKLTAESSRRRVKDEEKREKETRWELFAFFDLARANCTVHVAIVV